MRICLALLKLTLAPILIWQGKRVRAQTIRLPEATGERFGFVGADTAQTPFQLVVIGDSSAAGVGASTQSQALAYQTAVVLAQHLQRPVAWRLIAKSGLNTAQAYDLFIKMPAQAADAVLFALGVNDATSQVKANAFINNTAALWLAAQSTTGAKIGVFSGLPPVHAFPALPQPLRFYFGQCAFWLDGALQDWVAKQNLIYCPIASTLAGASVADMASDGYHPGPRIYAAWAQQAASLIAAKANA